jgi:hypothetical protein
VERNTRHRTDPGKENKFGADYRMKYSAERMSEKPAPSGEVGESCVCSLPPPPTTGIKGNSNSSGAKQRRANENYKFRGLATQERSNVGATRRQKQG